jgi:hypothetical protein
MRYWAFFAGKLAAIAGLSTGLFVALHRFWPAQKQFIYVDPARFAHDPGYTLVTSAGVLTIENPPRFAHDLGYTLAIGLLFLISCGMVYAAIWDQRYRCRVCLRRLRMPIETGSWSGMLQFGRPEIEYICTYGHGRLNVPEVHISGAETAEWTAQSDMWTELAGAGKPHGKEDHAD